MSEKTKNTQNTTPIEPVLAVATSGDDMNITRPIDNGYSYIEHAYETAENKSAVALSKAITAIDDSTRENELRKAVLLLAIREHALYKDLGCSNFEEYGHRFHDIEKSQLNKLCRIADKFFTLETVGEHTRLLSAKGGDTDLAIITDNAFTVHGLVDKFNKPFSMSAMNEMLTIGDDSQKRDILIQLIDSGDIYSKSPATSGDNSVRAILKNAFIKEGLVKAKNANSDDKNGNVGGDDDTSKTAKLVNETADKFTDKDRLNMIVSLVSTMKNEEMKQQFMNTDIIKLCEVWADDVQ